MRLQQRFRLAMREGNYSLETERSYWGWIRHYIRFHRIRHPDTMGGNEISQFLSYLVVKRHVAVNTQQQALSALVFLYRKVLNREELDINEWKPARRRKHLPVVFSRDEASRAISHMSGSYVRDKTYSKSVNTTGSFFEHELINTLLSKSKPRRNRLFAGR